MDLISAAKSIIYDILSKYDIISKYHIISNMKLLKKDKKKVISSFDDFYNLRATGFYEIPYSKDVVKFGFN